VLRMVRSRVDFIAVGAVLVVSIVQVQTLAQGPPCPPAQIEQLMPNCSESISFGQSVALSDGQLAVGRYDNSGGRVTTYSLDAKTRRWMPFQDLIPPGLTPHDSFGHSVVLHHDLVANRWLLAVGSQSRNSSQPDSGTAYVYSLDGSWNLTSTILPDEVLAYGWFGTVTTWAPIAGANVLVVGAPGSWGQRITGSTYVFQEDGNGEWRQQAHLQAPNGTPENNFGCSVSAGTNADVCILMVGASGYNGPGAQSGHAYAYRFDAPNGQWVHEATFEAPDPYDLDEFGKSVSVAPVYDIPGFTHRAAIGRRSEGGFGTRQGPGAVYLYLRTVAGDWQLEAHLLPPFANPYNMSLGHTVELQRDGTARLAAVAINSREYGTESGGAFVYDRNGTTGDWSVTQALYGMEQDSYDGFGVDFAFGDGQSTGMAVVGALATQCPGGSQFDSVGAVYSFDLNPGNGGNCPAPVITLQKVPDCSSGPGGEIEVRWFQATPDQRARIALLYAKRTGNFIIPNGNPCSGTSLRLGQLGLQVAYVGSAGQFGAGRLRRTVPRTVCGGYFQLVDVTRCATSNVVRIE